MNKILILFTFLTLFTTTQAEDIWQRLEQPRVDASFWDFFEVEGITYAWLNDGLFEFTGEEYIYIENPFFQDKGKIYSMLVKNGKGVMSSEAGIYYLEDNNWNKCENLSNERQLESLNFLGNKIVGKNHLRGNLLYSNDFGKTWNTLVIDNDTTIINTMYLQKDTLHCKSAHRYIKIYNAGDSLGHTTILVKPPYSTECILADDTKLYSGDYEKGVFKSTDYGESWFNIYPGGLITSLVKLDNILYIGTEKLGIALYNENNDSLSKKNLYLPNTVVTSLYVLNGYVYVDTWQGLYRTNNEMDGWENASFQSNVYTCLDLTKDNDRLFAVISNSAIKTSTDKGKSWSNLNEPLFEEKMSFWFLRIDNNLMLAYQFYGGLVQISEDYGKNWRVMNFPGTRISQFTVKDMTIFNGRIIISLIGILYYSDDLGENWSMVEDENIVPHLTSAIKFNITDDKLFLGTQSGGLLYTDKKGTDWSKFDFGDSVLNKLKIKTLKVYGNDYYIGTLDTGMVKWNSSTKEVNWFSDNLSSYGPVEDIVKLGNNIVVKTTTNVLISKDNGDNWESTFFDKGGNLSNLQLIDDTFFMGTWGGIFTTTFDKLGIVLTSVESEPNINITSAYPQPANDELRIELDNSAMKNRSLSAEDITIYDANGRLLANQDITIEGNKELVWLCKDIRAGVYFIAVAGKTVKVIIN